MFGVHFGIQNTLYQIIRYILDTQNLFRRMLRNIFRIISHGIFLSNPLNAINICMSNFWFNPKLLQDMQVDKSHGNYVKRHCDEFEISPLTQAKMLRAFAEEKVNLKYLPEELSYKSVWQESEAWERLALDNGYVMIKENLIIANDPKLIWMTLKPFVLNEIIYEEMNLVVSKSDSLNEITLQEDDIQNVLREGITSLSNRFVH